MKSLLNKEKILSSGFNMYMAEPIVSKNLMEALAAKCIDPYLKKHNREYAEDFASHLLRVNRFDLKIAQDFHIKIKNTLQLNVNILNFGNLLNNSWGQTKSIAASNWRGDIALQKNETENRPMFSMNTLAKIQKNGTPYRNVLQTKHCR